MITTACNSCFQRFEVMVRPHEAHLVTSITDKDGLCPCPRHCGGKIIVVPDESFLKLLESMPPSQPLGITGTELYQAVNGMGLPDEVPKDVAVITAMMKDKTIKDVVLEQVDDRFYLHELVLLSGLRVHLTAGGRGAQILKVTHA